MRMRHPTHFQQERSGRSCRIRWAAPGRMRTHAQDTACPSLLRGPRRRKPARSVSHPSHRKGSAGAGRPRHARRTCPPTEATAGPAATLSWPARGRCRAWPQAARTRRAAPCSARGRAAGSHAQQREREARQRGAGQATLRTCSISVMSAMSRVIRSMFCAPAAAARSQRNMRSRARARSGAPGAHG